MNKIIPMCFVLACSSPQNEPLLTDQIVETDALLQAVSIVDKNTVWISGHKGTFLRTKDAGNSWEIFQHPTGDTLQFRDVHAFAANRIILMSAGPGPLSRIFEVKDGREWSEHFVMPDSLGFLDCLDFWDDQKGIAYGDAIDGYPYVLLTSDGGSNWTRADTTNMPKAGNGEGGFAASGTCVTTGRDGLAWIATGAGGNARILITKNFGQTWESYASPIVKGEAAGHTSIDFVDGKVGFTTGGDLALSDVYTENCAFTSDGGSTWSLTKKPMTKGAFYGSATIQLGAQNFTVVCGPKGLDYTLDMGQKWVQLDSANLWAVDMHPSGVGWASGKDGKVIKIEVQ